MQAVSLTGPKQLEPIETKTVEPKNGQVVIEVSACGICGSDLHYWELGCGMDGKSGLIPGHEFSGRVADPGSRQDLLVGERVTALPLNPCGECRTCLSGALNTCLKAGRRPIPGNNSPGAFAEKVAVRPDMVRKLPDSISDIDASMVEPAAVSLHAINKLGIKPGDTVLVTGCGPIGLLCSWWAKICGASRVIMTDIDQFRIGFADKNRFADEVVDGKDPNLRKAIAGASKGGVDTAVETSGSDAGLGTVISSLKTGGKMVLAGMNFNPQPVNTMLLAVKELELYSSLAYLPSEFDTALEYIEKKELPVAQLVTSTIGLEEAQKAFEKLSSGQGDDIKVIIQPRL